MMQNAPAAIQQLHSAAECWLFCHVSPDGDTLGSALGLRCALQAAGKRVRIFCADAPGARYAFLPGVDAIETEPPIAVIEGYPVDTLAATAANPAVNVLGIAIDISDLGRFGTMQGTFAALARTLCVDHHGTNDGYATVNIVDPDAAATAVLMWHLIRDAALPVPADAALCLYAGISTDTGNFAFENTDASALRAAADLLEYGIDVGDLTRRLYRENTLAHTSLLARAIDGMQVLHGGRAALMLLHHADFAATGAVDADSEGIIAAGIELKGVCVAAMLREQGDAVKASFRSVAPYDVAAVCRRLGGGGHARAAGATIHMGLYEAAALVEAELGRCLEDA